MYYVGPVWMCFGKLDLTIKMGLTFLERLHWEKQLQFWEPFLTALRVGVWYHLAEKEFR